MIPALENRRSVRRFEERAVEKEKILALLEAGRLAPSGDNLQPSHWVVVEDRETIRRIAEMSDNHQMWIVGAPVVIVMAADLSRRLPGSEGMEISDQSPQYEVKQVIRDGAIAGEQMVLEAVEQGLGSCWVGWQEQKEIRSLLGIPENVFVFAVLPVGYPAQEPKARPRVPLEERVHWEKW